MAISLLIHGIYRHALRSCAINTYTQLLIFTLAIWLGGLQVMLASSVDLQFLEERDTIDPSGRLEFKVNGLKYKDKALYGRAPTIRLIKAADDRPGLWAYGLLFDSEGKEETWSLVRYFSSDGYTFSSPQILYTESGSDWLTASSMAFNQKTGDYLLLRHRSRREQDFGFSKWAYSSTDGIHWKRLAEKPVYYDHDSMSLIWDPATEQYIALQTTYENRPKPIPDNLGNNVRRVLSIRKSTDGISWEPSAIVGFPNKPLFRLDEQSLIRPNENDPPDMEFYHMQAFAYGDRYAAFVLNYAPSPAIVNPVTAIPGHGVFLSAEWWLSDDGINWRRPYQGQNVLGELTTTLTHAPIVTNQEMSFLVGGFRYSIDRNRLAGVFTQSNGAFSTSRFAMPETPLLLNATAKSLEPPVVIGRFLPHQQAYIIAELQDESGQVIPGYEREKMVLQNVDSLALPLHWEGKDGTELAGQTVRLRFYFRDATIYGVRSAAAWIASPQNGATLTDVTQIQIGIADLASNVRVALDGKVLYEGRGKPGKLTIQPAELDGGTHNLVLTAVDTKGQIDQETVEFHVAHARLVFTHSTVQELSDEVRLQVEPLISQDELKLISISLIPTNEGIQRNQVDIYTGTTLPEIVRFDTREIADGSYNLILRTETQHETSSFMSYQVTIRNWDVFVDTILPPVNISWYGTVDRIKTYAKSTGWQYDTGTPELFFSDTTRIKQSGAAIEFLTWKQPGLRSLSLTAYTRTTDLKSALTVSVSLDDKNWHEVAFAVDTEASNAVWSKVIVNGVVPGEIAAGYLRFTLNEKGADTIQLGQLELRSTRSDN